MREKKYIPFWTKEENKVDKNILSIILLAHVQQPRGLLIFNSLSVYHFI